MKKEANQLNKEWKPKPFCKSKPLIPVHTTQVQECFMSREEDFPKLETFNKNGSRHTQKSKMLPQQFFQVEKLLNQIPQKMF